VTLAASTLCASRRPLAEALQVLRDNGFRAVDLPAHEGWAHVSPSALADEPARVTAEVEADLGDLPVVALNAGAGTSDPVEELRRVEALLTLAADLGARVLTLPAGPLEGPGVEDDLVRVRRFVDRAADVGVRMTLETHRFTTWEDPRTVVRYVEEIDGLGVTLDPSHFTTGPHAHLGFESVLPAVAHVHLRSAGDDWSTIQLPAGSGNLSEPDLVARLRATGYDGAFSVEYVDTIPGVDHVLEARRMADLVRPYLETLSGSSSTY
jgi:sugar phosphate isomerase/epimerase